MFSNRSDHTVSVYRAPLQARLDGGPPMPRAQPLLRLAPGQVGSVPAETGQEFVVTAPDWSRPVEAITAGTWSRRVFVSEDDLHAIGTRKYSTSFGNRSGSPVIVNQEIDGSEIGWVALANGESRLLISYERQNWVVRDGETGDVLQRATTPAGNAAVMIRPRHMAPGLPGFGRPPHGGGGGHGHGDHGHGPGHVERPIDHVTLTITTTDRVISCLTRRNRRDPHFSRLTNTSISGRVTLKSAASTAAIKPERARKIMTERTSGSIQFASRPADPSEPRKRFASVNPPLFSHNFVPDVGIFAHNRIPMVAQDAGSHRRRDEVGVRSTVS